MIPKLNLLVVRTTQIENIQKQYAALGFKFDYHRHGNGPFHYASEDLGFVFELYPTSIKQDTRLHPRLGFQIEISDALKQKLETTQWEIKEWNVHNNNAVIIDLDGRTVELTS